MTFRRVIIPVIDQVINSKIKLVMINNRGILLDLDTQGPVGGRTTPQSPGPTRTVKR